MRVGHIHAEALKAAFIDGVEERLLLVEIGDGGGGVFNRAVEVFQALANLRHALFELGNGLFPFGNRGWGVFET